MPRSLKYSRGFTLTEILIVCVLISMVLLAGVSLYTSSLRFMRAQEAMDVTTLPDVALEDLARKISVANSATRTRGNNQLNLRIDYTGCNWGALDPAGPANTAGDSWWHYRLRGGNGNGELLVYCDDTPDPNVGSGGTPGTLLLPNLNNAGGGSTFNITNPSGAGNPTVVNVHVVSVTPTVTVDTEVALGAAPKN